VTPFSFPIVLPVMMVDKLVSGTGPSGPFSCCSCYSCCYCYFL